jgi:hypothetical protein
MPAGLGHLLGYVPPAGAAFHRERHRPGYRWVEPGQPVGQVFPVGRGAVHHGLAFSNNTAEQAGRMVKSKTRVSGGFRTLKGAQIFLAVRGYISTIRKNGFRAATELRNALLGNPWMPPTTAGPE